jgi:uncharacterized membrane protein required for colicin V production
LDMLHPMNRIDIAILIIVFIFGIAGYFRGLFREVISLSSTLGGYLAAVWKAGAAASFLSAVLPWQEHVVYISVFALICFPVSWLIEIVLTFFYNQIKTQSKNVVLRFTGSLLGFFKGLFFASLLTLLFSVILSERKIADEKDRSLFLKPAKAVAPAVLEWTSEWFSSTRSNYQEVKKQFSRLDQIKIPNSPGTDHESDPSK